MRKTHPNDKMCEDTNANTFTESEKPLEACCFLITVFTHTPYLFQQLTDLVPILSLTIIDDMVPPSATLDYLPQAWVLFLQVLL